MAWNKADRVSIVLGVGILAFFLSPGKCLPNTGLGAHGKLDLIPGKETFERNYISYYMYNITNPDEFEKGEKPIMEEVGPYVYKESRRKFDVRKVSDSVMQYSLDRYWEFVPEMSKGHEETDEFNIINIPMIILANKLSAKRLPKAFNDILVDELTEKGETFVRRNEELGNILYYGMNVSVYTEILADVLQGNVPPEFQDGIFALFKGKNGSTEGSFTVRTTGNHVGDILSFNNKTKLDYWTGDYCNKIEGTDGYFFRPDVKKNSPLMIFYPELCRSVKLTWKGEKSVKGLTVDSFSFSDDMLDSHESKPEHLCFCSKPVVPSNETTAGCLKKGFVDYGSCKQDSPLLVSFPHFLHADEEYSKKLVGMKPEPQKHESEFLVEPRTGTILRGSRKFQFNVKLSPLDNVELFRNATFMIVPVFVVERDMIVPEMKIEKLREDLQTMMMSAKKATKIPDSKQLKPEGEPKKKDKGRDDLDSENYLSDDPSPDPEGSSSSTEPTFELTVEEDPGISNNEVPNQANRFSKTLSVASGSYHLECYYSLLVLVLSVSLFHAS